MPDRQIVEEMKKLHQKESVETIRVRITGRVQGVGFRATAVRHAHMLGVTGWVRNERDGSVEVMLQGGHEQVDRMLSWLHVGPPGAKVTEIEHAEEPTDRRYDRFEQI